MNDADNTVDIEFTPTIPHCSMATLIGLSIKVKLLRCLPNRFKVCVFLIVTSFFFLIYEHPECFLFRLFSD